METSVTGLRPRQPDKYHGQWDFLLLGNWIFSVDQYFILTSNFDSATCHVCIRTKQAKKPYYPVKEKTKWKLERVHSDICDQYPESKGNSIHNLTFLYDFTHWCWTKSIPNQNSDTIREAFNDLLKQIKNETELNIKYLRTDNGGEYTDNGGEYAGDFLPLLKEIGIIHEHGPPHSP